MDIESLLKCALDDRRELHQFAQDGLICQVNFGQPPAFFQIFRSMFLTTQLYCYIKFFLLWNLRFCIVKLMAFVNYLHRGDSGICEDE